MQDGSEEEDSTVSFPSIRTLIISQDNADIDGPVNIDANHMFKFIGKHCPNVSILEIKGVPSLLDPSPQYLLEISDARPRRRFRH